MNSFLNADSCQRRRVGLGVGLLVVFVLLSLPAPAAAVTINVTTTADELGSGSSCSLREAVWAANNDSTAMAQGCASGAGTDVVVVPAGEFFLTREAEMPLVTDEDAGIYGDLDVTGPLTIVHRGILPASIVAAADGERVIHALAPGGLILEGLTISSGSAASETSRGGGILNEGLLTVLNSRISNNLSAYGGGLAIEGASRAILRNVTVQRNFALADGGGISVETGGIVSLGNVTVAYNFVIGDAGSGGAGLFASTGGILTMRNTLVAKNPSRKQNGVHDCSRLGGMIVSRGHNLIGNTNGCDYEAGPRDIVNRNAKLIDEKDNGGPTETVALRNDRSGPLGRKAMSPAINAGAGCTTTDQRGVKRRLGGRCDIGAYELASCEGRAINRVGTGGPDLLVGDQGDRQLPCPRRQGHDARRHRQGRPLWRRR